MNIAPEKYTNRLLASDIEAKGFYDDVHSAEDVWCICSVDVETEEVFLFHDYPEYDNQEGVDPHDKKPFKIPTRSGTLIEGARFWYMAAQNNSKLIVHHALGYDKPVIEKVFPKCVIPLDAWEDTLIHSKVQWFDRDTPRGCKSGHGLEAYGKRAGVNKPPINDWTTMDIFKLHRVIEDVTIQAYTHKYLEKERTLLKDKIGVTFDEALTHEKPYRLGCTEQEINGALVDKEHILRCIEFLDGRTNELAKEIEPKLPPTVKVHSSKVTRKEVAKALGFKGKVEDTYEKVKRNGEEITQPEKPYYKPSTNFHKTDKVNIYEGFNLSYGSSPKFTKKKDFNAWVKEHHPETKPKDWDVEKSLEETKLLNAKACEWFEVEPTDTDKIVGAHTKISFIASGLTQHEVVKGFLIRLGWKSADEWNLKKDSEGSFVKADKYTEVRYPKKAHRNDQMVFKVKAGEIMVTSPKLSEKDYEQLPEGVGKQIAEYNTYMHRRRFLSNPKDPENKGILSAVREDSRMPCGVNVFGCATSRSTHQNWVNPPGVGALYGEEIRKCVIAPKGKKLVGADMKSAQLAIASFYAKNYDYYSAVASGQEEVKDSEGNDVYVGESAHCFSARAFGMVSQEEWKEAVSQQDHTLIHSIALRRKKSKGASFGVIFGCSGKKLAGMLGIPESEGNEKKNNFLEQMGLQGVAEWLKTCKKKYKRGAGWYIPLPFGYWVFCKSDHKAINYVIQGCEAVCQKVAVNYFNEHNNFKGTLKVMDYTDEFLTEAPEELADEVGALISESYKYASDECFRWYTENPDKFPNEGKPLFPFNLDGGYKIGNNYLEVH
jgi:hypothetical protein